MLKKKAVIDSNEIILGLTTENTSSAIFIIKLNELKDKYEFIISDDIYQEVMRNIPNYTKEKFSKLLEFKIITINDFLTDVELFQKYKNLGFKKGDIAIASFADKENADILISENRHFLKWLQTRKFKILNAEQFLKEIIKF
ncbi:type II toxin-antitoxin system VapC family toxin [Candidatus Woesearchaeota archaeon]|nr:type II toxin-antitoxin system VapC family toxin [Candidatus Woesearchaeota archaeon]